MDVETAHALACLLGPKQENPDNWLAYFMYKEGDNLEGTEARESFLEGLTRDRDSPWYGRSVESLERMVDRKRDTAAEVVGYLRAKEEPR